MRKETVIWHDKIVRCTKSCFWKKFTDVSYYSYYKISTELSLVMCGLNRWQRYSFSAKRFLEINYFVMICSWRHIFSQISVAFSPVFLLGKQHETLLIYAAIAICNFVPIHFVSLTCPHLLNFSIVQSSTPSYSMRLTLHCTGTNVSQIVNFGLVSANLSKYADFQRSCQLFFFVQTTS